jgi:hypothetical protein
MKESDSNLFESKYRLRKDEKIVGYMRTIHGNSFFSPDNYAWSGKEIEFLQTDLFSGYFDLNRTPLFAEDIIQTTAHPQLHLILHWDESLNTFQLIDYSNFSIFEADASKFFESNTAFKRISFTFINKPA